MRHNKQTKPVRTIVSPLDPVRNPSALFSCACCAVQVDLLLGTWAEKNVPGLSSSEMDSYEDILNLETVDIFNFVTGNAEPPSFVDTLMLARLQVTLEMVEHRLEGSVPCYGTSDSPDVCLQVLRTVFAYYETEVVLQNKDGMKLIYVVVFVVHTRQTLIASNDGRRADVHAHAPHVSID